MTSTPVRGLRRGQGAARWTVRTTVPVAVAALTISLLAPSAPAATPAAPAAADPGVPTSRSVTLVTGDVVRVGTAADGKQTLALEPRPDGSVVEAAINVVNGHTFVVPTEAYGLLAAKRLDRSLFDVTQLLADEYDDASRDTLPVLVDYGTGAGAAKEAKGASLLSAERTVVVPVLGIAAFRAEKSKARAFWADLTRGSDSHGNPTGLSDGAAKVLLDGRVHVDLEDSVPQIHAPQAWAEGYTGAGATVAVLDTGWDQGHPDLPSSLVVGSANFTPDASVQDGNGHGTHVASTIVGTGAASAGARKGVAPGAHLLVGKVLADAGFGEDSWVLAGMQWAVEQHADVVSMSLGGDFDDGTNPLAQAVNELSASSDTLFVIAAGNSGSQPSTVTAPGSADAALTVGAVDVTDHMADFSSRGPRLRDGALKPEVVAPGVDVTAARAAGTDLGGDLATDTWYTTISGTSMATPHVAGLAAILKGEHPTWDGEQLKDAIVNSTVTVPGATAFESGTGRIDALQAVHQTVFAPGTLELGNFAWPHSDLSPSSTALTYRNTGATPVTLDLALTAEDGSAEPTGSLSLAAPSVTVPAGGTASVDVTVDPTIADPGAYSGVVTATVEGGTQTVRTGVAYQLEPERYDVTISVVPRAGTTVGHLLALSGFQDPWTYESRTFDASPDTKTVTFRVPPGDYSTNVVSNGVASDGSHEGVLSYLPSFSVTADTTVVLDENDTKLFRTKVDRPVVNDGTLADVTWKGDAGETEFVYHGSPDRLFVRPSAGLPGTTKIATQWLLSQPEAVATTSAAHQVALRPVVASGTNVFDSPVPALKGSYVVADAGAVGDLDTAHVKGRVALVAGSCENVVDAVAQLRDAKAVAVLVHPAAGASCAGTATTEPVLPTFEVGSSQLTYLTAKPKDAVSFVSHRNPAYVYDLLRYFPGSVPAGATVDGTGAAVGAVRETYRGLNSTSAANLAILEEPYGAIAARENVITVLARRVQFPSTVTHFVSTGAVWQRVVHVQDATWFGDWAIIAAPPRTFPGGSTVKDTWFGGPLVTGVSKLAPAGYLPVRRVCTDPDECGDRDEMRIDLMGAFRDAAGHTGHSEVIDPEYSGKIYADGDLLVDSYASVFLSNEVPRGRHRFRVVTDFHRENPFWALSTRIVTSWRFVSGTPTSADGIAILPMLTVDYGMKLSSTNQAPAGTYTFTVGFRMPTGVAAAPITAPSVEVSWDGGSTWRTLRTTCAKNSCTVGLTNLAGRDASFRVKGTDTLGRSVSQTVLKAYTVG